MEQNNYIHQILNNKKVLFITTKNLDYLRNTQEIDIIKESTEHLDILGYKDKSYFKRLVKIYCKLMKLVFTNDYDVIFIGFAPQLVLPFLKSLKNRSYIITDFFISCYDTLVFDRKKFRDKTFISRKIFNIDKATLLQSNHIICDTKAHQQYFADTFGMDKSNSTVLYLKADTTIYFPHQVERPEKLKNKFIVLYFGSILPLQGVDIVLKSAKLLENQDDIFFYIIGPLTDEQKKEYSELKNTEFIHWLSQDKLSDKIAEADLCLAGHFSNTIDKAKRTIPGKAYIYDAMKKPMILGDSPANHELYKPSNDIYFVEMGNHTALSELILSIYRGKTDNENQL